MMVTVQSALHTCRQRVVIQNKTSEIFSLMEAVLRSEEKGRWGSGYEESCEILRGGIKSERMGFGRKTDARLSMEMEMKRYEKTKRQLTGHRRLQLRARAQAPDRMKAAPGLLSAFPRFAPFHRHIGDSKKLRFPLSMGYTGKHSN